MRNATRAIILEGWLLNSVQWTNRDGKLKIAMSKRDVAVRIITHKVVTNFLSFQTRQSFFMIIDMVVVHVTGMDEHIQQVPKHVWTTLKNA